MLLVLGGGPSKTYFVLEAASFRCHFNRVLGFPSKFSTQLFELSQFKRVKYHGIRSSFDVLLIYFNFVKQFTVEGYSVIFPAGSVKDGPSRNIHLLTIIFVQNSEVKGFVIVFMISDLSIFNGYLNLLIFALGLLIILNIERTNNWLIISSLS